MNKYNVLTFVCLMLLIFLTITNITKHPAKLIEKKEIVSTIDSVWYSYPGKENVLQLDYKYYGRLTNGQVVSSTSNKFHIGDSVVCIYHRYENPKKEKK